MGIPNLEKASAEQVLAWQWRQVKELLQRAEQVPFYRRLFKAKKIKVEKIKTWSDFSHLPLTTENDLRRRPEDFFFPAARLWRIFATSGTTGEPKLIWRQPIKKNSAVVFLWRQLWQRAGVWPRLVAVMRPAGGLGASGPVTARVFEELGIPVFTASPEADLAATARAFLRIKPDTVVISPSFALLLFYFLKKQGTSLSQLGLKTIISTGEALRLNERRWLKAELGAQIINTYGAADPSVWLASECSARQGLHIFPYTAYLETVNGRLVVTPFANQATVLVRYALGDKVKLEEKECSCGRTLPRIVSIERPERPLAIKIGRHKAKVHPVRDLTLILANIQGLTSFFNFIYYPQRNLIKIIVEADFVACSPAKRKVLRAALRARAWRRWPRLARACSAKQIQVRFYLVEIGRLPRRAAKLVEPVKVEA